MQVFTSMFVKGRSKLESHCVNTKENQVRQSSNGELFQNGAIAENGSTVGKL